MAHILLIKDVLQCLNLFSLREINTGRGGGANAVNYCLLWVITKTCIVGYKWVGMQAFPHIPV